MPDAQQVATIEEHVKDRSVGENIKRDGGGKSREPRNKPREPKDKRPNDRPPPKKICDDERPVSRKRGEQGVYERERSRSARGGRGRGASGSGGGSGREFVRGGLQARGRTSGGFGLPATATTRGRGRGRREQPVSEPRPQYERDPHRGWETPRNDNNVESDRSDGEEFEDTRRRTHGEDSDVSLDENSAYVSESSTEKPVAALLQDPAPRGRVGSNRLSSRQGGSRGSHRGGRDNREHTGYNERVVGQGFGRPGERRPPSDRLPGDSSRKDDGGGFGSEGRGGPSGRSNSMGMASHRGESGYRGRGACMFIAVLYWLVVLMYQYGRLSIVTKMYCFDLLLCLLFL